MLHDGSRFAIQAAMAAMVFQIDQRNFCEVLGKQILQVGAIILDLPQFRKKQYNSKPKVVAVEKFDAPMRSSMER